MAEIVDISAFRCRVWDQHGRMEEYVTEASCREEMRSMEQHGQLIPAIGRRVHNDTAFDVEIICGSRRLFVARQLNILLRVELKTLTDHEAVVFLDMENRQRKDWSAYERGRSFARWLGSGIFESQESIADVLGMSASQVSRLL